MSFTAACAVGNMERVETLLYQSDVNEVDEVEKNEKK
jgi:hypothetical protein